MVTWAHTGPGRHVLHTRTLCTGYVCHVLSITSELDLCELYSVVTSCEFGNVMCLGSGTVWLLALSPAITLIYWLPRAVCFVTIVFTLVLAGCQFPQDSEYTAAISMYMCRIKILNIT